MKGLEASSMSYALLSLEEFVFCSIVTCDQAFFLFRGVEKSPNSDQNTVEKKFYGSVGIRNKMARYFLLFRPFQGRRLFIFFEILSRGFRKH